MAAETEDNNINRYGVTDNSDDDIALEQARQQHIRDLEAHLKKLDRQFYALCLVVIIIIVMGLVALVLFSIKS
jgi:hypothetical protein